MNSRVTDRFHKEETMKIKVYIHAAWNEWDKEYSFRPWSQDMSSQASCGPLVGEVEIDFTPPPREVMVNGQIASFREQQKQIRAESERQCMEIQERIDNLLCIEHKPETA